LLRRLKMLKAHPKLERNELLSKLSNRLQKLRRSRLFHPKMSVNRLTRAFNLDRHDRELKLEQRSET